MTTTAEARPTVSVAVDHGNERDPHTLPSGRGKGDAYSLASLSYGNILVSDAADMSDPEPPETPLQRLKRWSDRAKSWAAYAGLVIILVVVYLGSFLPGSVRDTLLPAAVIAIVGYLVLSLQNVETALSKQSLGQRASAVVLSDAERVGLKGVTVHLGLWSPPAPHKEFAAVGMRIRFVQDEAFLAQLESVLRLGGTVTLVMADPRSQQVWARYRDEPLPLPYGREAVGEANQMSNLANLLCIAYGWRDRLTSKGVDVSRLFLGMFQHYPQAAYYVVDGDLFTYHYPYRSRGLDGPVYRYSAFGTTGQHLRECLKKVLQDARALDDVEFEDLKRWQGDGRLYDNVILKLPQ